MLLAIAFLCFAALLAAWIVTPTTPISPQVSPTDAMAMPEPGRMPA
jgi:hypothetical protein